MSTRLVDFGSIETKIVVFVHDDVTQHLGIAQFKFYHLKKKNLPDDGTHSIRSFFQCYEYLREIAKDNLTEK